MEISLDILIITIYVLMIIILYLPIDNLKKIIVKFINKKNVPYRISFISLFFFFFKKKL